MAGKHEITGADIMAMDDYAKLRAERRREITALKANRRLEVGPFATFHFESYETMLHQVHEMLLIERGGEAQISGELAAYNPLVPKGRELVATVMLEIADAERRAGLLAALGGIEETATIAFGSETVAGAPEADIDRTTAAGKASSVQFVHFPFTDAQVIAFRAPGARVVVGLDHPNYAHMAVMPEEMRRTLAADFD